MPPKKKNPPNGFMIFTFEWKAKYGKRMTTSEATAEAGKVWEKMTAQERGPYLAKAKEEKLGFKGKAEKLTCTGVPVSHVEKEKQEFDQRERQMKRNIETTVRNSVKEGELETQSYFFIMVNYFTKALKGGVYVPAEISVCEYSLKEGVQRMYHTCVNPGVTIYGHQYEAQHHSDTTHKLPLPPNAMGETCLSRIYNDILDLVRCRKTGKYAPLYTNRDCIHIVQSVLDFLMTEPGASNTNLEIYSIQYLFYILKEATCEAGEIEKPKSFFITDAFFERDHFEYTVGCYYHDELDRNRYCTKSYVTRWGYIFSDYMCRDLAISMIPERHCPRDTNLNAIINDPALSTYNDTHSIVSMNTEASYATKALPEHKLYDDSKSLISEATYSPAWAKASNVSTSQFDGDDFPSLNKYANRKKASPSTAAAAGSSNRSSRNLRDVKTYLDGNEEDERNLNPWASRSRNIPPKSFDASAYEESMRDDDDELNSSFGLSDTEDYGLISGRGRGRANSFHRSFNSSSASSYGRGRSPYSP